MRQTSALVAPTHFLPGLPAPFLTAPACSMFTCDVGGELNKVTHFYAYDNVAAREAMRKAAARDARWVAYVDAGRKHMIKQVKQGGTEGVQAGRHQGDIASAAAVEQPR